jgi:sterol desaturase/sphingolipid hydroxylase (fatty acid hydroxylase superfamily)
LNDTEHHQRRYGAALFGVYIFIYDRLGDTAFKKVWLGMASQTQTQTQIQTQNKRKYKRKYKRKTNAKQTQIQTQNKRKYKRKTAKQMQ